MTVFIRLTVALAWWLAIPPALGGPPRCQIVPVADARLRLEVWERELVGARGAVAAHAARRVAWVADRQGTVIEALFLVTLQAAVAPGRLDQRPPRPQWVHCARWDANPWR
jgi:hypothetical protein